MPKPTTQAAARTLDWLRTERDFWAETADADEVNTHLRYAAVARRDQLDMLLQRMPAELAAVEAEAGEDRAVSEWLDAGAGIGDGAWEALPDAA